jgi:RimJ/RimL family protein N-acetyltransferase
METNIFAESNYFYTVIRQATQQDLDFFYKLYMHPATNTFLLYEQMPTAEFEPIFADLLDKAILYVFEAEGRKTGMFKLIPLTYRCSHIAYLGGLAIGPDLAGKGYGFAMLQEILDLVKSKGLVRVELSVADINEKAIKLYEKAGFKKEGVLRKYAYLKKENRFMDEILMSWLNEEAH